MNVDLLRAKEALTLVEVVQTAESKTKSPLRQTLVVTILAATAAVPAAMTT